MRVGHRQYACSAEACRKKRRARSQKAWLERRPDYFVARWIAKRAKRKEKDGRDVEPLRLPRPLDRLPWDVVQDEFGTQGADLFGFFGKVLLEHVQDEIGSQVRDMAMEFRRHRPGL